MQSSRSEQPGGGTDTGLTPVSRGERARAAVTPGDVLTSQCPGQVEDAGSRLQVRHVLLHRSERLQLLKFRDGSEWEGTRPEPQSQNNWSFSGPG